MTFEAGDQCIVTGLKERKDLNNKTVLLTKWNPDCERWEAKSPSGEGIRVREVNLILKRTSVSSSPPAKVEKKKKANSVVHPYVLPPVVGNVLKEMVRGGGLADELVNEFPFVHNG